MDRAVIVAGGWSVRPEHLEFLNKTLLPAHIIGVNDASRYLDHPSCTVTMDRKWMENRHEEFTARGRVIYWRAGTVKSAAPSLMHRAFANENIPGPMVDQGEGEMLHLEGNNSGTCALNLAYIRRYSMVYLLGFDMQKGPNDENHFYPDYPWNPRATKPKALEGWAGGYEHIAKQFSRRGIHVFNVNDRTKLLAFPIISFDQFRSQIA